MRVTSAPSARPLVSRMTCPMIAPMAFMLPARILSAASALAWSAASTIGSSSSPPPLAARPSASPLGPPAADRPGLVAPADRRQPLGLDDGLRVAALGHEAVEDLLARVLRDLLA